jgi:hypothetical protein
MLHRPRPQAHGCEDPSTGVRPARLQSGRKLESLHRRFGNPNPDSIISDRALAEIIAPHARHGSFGHWLRAMGITSRPAYPRPGHSTRRRRRARWSESSRKNAWVLKSCVDAPVDAGGFLMAPAMIGCGHVSGLEVRLCHMPRAGMEIRRPGADQNRERLKPVDPNCFSWPRPVRSVCPYRSSTFLIADAPAEAACRSGRRQR